MTPLPENVAGEQLYLAYRHAKRRWRRFTGGFKRLHHRRFRKGKGSKGFRKGKSFGKGFKGFPGKTPGHSGKGKGRMFFLDDSGSFVPVEDQSVHSYLTEPADDEQIVYLAGKGGKFKRKNPKGKDGKLLLCSLCGSDEHLIKQCSQNTQGLNYTQHKQQSGGQRSFAALSVGPSSSSGMSQWSQSIYFGTEAMPKESASTCLIEIEGQTVELDSATTDEQASTKQQKHYYMPGHTLPKNPTLSAASSNKAALEKEFAFAWFMPFYHANVRGEGFEGLLVDVGAIGNLCGSGFISRICKRAGKYGQSCAFQKLKQPLSVEGVGKQSDRTEEECIAPICLPDGRTGTFTTPVIQDSELPALLGLNTLSQERALIDCFNRQIVFVGPGGYRLQASPGSRTYKLESAKTGHLLLPCDCWDKAKISSQEKQLAF